MWVEVGLGGSGVNRSKVIGGSVERGGRVEIYSGMCVRMNMCHYVWCL